MQLDTYMPSIASKVFCYSTSVQMHALYRRGEPTCVETCWSALRDYESDVQHTWHISSMPTTCRQTLFFPYYNSYYGCKSETCLISCYLVDNVRLRSLLTTVECCSYITHGSCDCLLIAFM